MCLFLLHQSALVLQPALLAYGFRVDGVLLVGVDGVSGRKGRAACSCSAIHCWSDVRETRVTLPTWSDGRPASRISLYTLTRPVRRIAATSGMLRSCGCTAGVVVSGDVCRFRAIVSSPFYSQGRSVNRGNCVAVGDPFAGSAGGISCGRICNVTSPLFVYPMCFHPARRKQRPQSRFLRTFVVSTKVIMPRSGGVPHCQRVAATACVMRSLESMADSLRKSVQSQAPAHACITYWV